MLRRLRETAPAGLVPLAWLFAFAAHEGALADRTVLVGHVVMTALLVAFAALSYEDMRDHPVLRAWLAVIVVGIPVTAAGAYGVWSGDTAFALLAVVGWMALPAVALAYTGRVLPSAERARVYTLGGALSGVGAALLLVGTAVPVAFLCVGAGQTAGILAATLTY
ncbi:hypothetical protein [Halosegnis marinus]|uniref:Uncharacterized protein n=1 Tax=Halosegnis marinus TaxID=3034023 RepID=A0ABD5ZPG9_9EURY|nr:hypothetical protein [Halosegnis sp. DT85]